jgi:serine/threonine-protein kinase RsbW
MPGEIEIRPLAAEDAAKLTDCFGRCYGDSYVVDFFYDPEAIRARMADGRVYSVVALTPDGEIVGHMAMMRPHSGALTVELGNTIVDPRRALRSVPRRRLCRLTTTRRPRTRS